MRRRLSRVFPFRIWHAVSSSHYVLLALLFYVGLQLISTFHQRILLLALMLLGLVTYGIVLVRIEERHSFHPMQSVLPVLTAAGLIGFAFFLPPGWILQIYCVLAALALYWLLKHGAKRAYPTWNWTLTAIILFCNIAVILGLRFHIFLPVTLTLALVFTVSFLLALQALRRLSGSAGQAVVLAACLALALTQLAWVFQFLPVHFLVQSGVLLVVYYVAFNLVAISFERRLRRQELSEYAIVGVVALVILLWSARWL